MWRDTTNSKLMPRSIYDVLTQSSSDLQRPLCHIQCGQPQAVGLFIHLFIFWLVMNGR